MPTCSSLTSSTTILPSVTWRTPFATRRSDSGVCDFRSPNAEMRLRTSSRDSPRERVIFSISRSRRSRAKPTSVAVPRGSRLLSTTTSSPMNPMTIDGAAWSPSVAAVVNASMPRWTRGCVGE
ncbi:MAG: hypothetical protein AUJ01_01115 [Acidobacteria bacterium 13_1_40CM_3_65_5]|nr:MAG: hypothetical protein AUJ01_01115 [Acidobacteria bacterium 13_1_40CM_3_65_5]